MKKILIVLGILFFTLTTFQIIQSYGLFETKVYTESDLKIASWHISVNDSDITGENKTFRVNNITYKDHSGKETQKFAPGVTGTFILVIDPKDTEVSFKYELDTKLISDYSQISITNIEGINNTNLTLENGVYSNVMTVKDIKNNKKDYIKITFSWENNDDNNESDSLIGSNLESLEIPINIKFTQQK